MLDYISTTELLGDDDAHSPEVSSTAVYNHPSSRRSPFLLHRDDDDDEEKTARSSSTNHHHTFPNQRGAAASSSSTTTRALAGAIFSFESYVSPVLAIHVAFMLTAFVLLLPLGAAFAILGDRSTGKWFLPHLVLQHLGAVFALAGFGLGIAYRTQRYGGGHFTAPHHIIGIVVVLLVLLQLSLGWGRPHPPEKDTPPTTSRRVWLWLHRFVALSLFVLAFTNIILGPITYFQPFNAPISESDASGIVLMAVPYELGALAILSLLVAVLYRCSHTSWTPPRRGDPSDQTPASSSRMNAAQDAQAAVPASDPEFFTRGNSQMIRSDGLGDETGENDGVAEVEVDLA